MIMHKLNHDRVVKLLGVILEDGNYSLVIEYVRKGDLMSVLKAVSRKYIDNSQHNPLKTFPQVNALQMCWIRISIVPSQCPTLMDLNNSEIVL